MIDTDTAPTQLRVTKTPDQLADEVYDLEFYGTGETISNRLRQIRLFNQPDERIGGLLELRDLAQTAAAQGWAYRALDRMQLGIREYIPSAKTPLERLLAEDVAEYIDDETRQSTLGMPIVVENDGRYVKSGRASSDSSLLKDIPIEKYLLTPNIAHVRRLATDTIAMTDSAGMPIKVAEYHDELRGSGLGVLHRALDNYQSPYSLILDSVDVFDDARSASPANEKIIQMADILGVDVENLCGYLGAVYEVQAFQEKVNNAFSQIQRDAENRNTELSKQFVEQALGALGNYAGDDEYLSRNIEEATKSYRGGYLERSFTSVENALRRAGILGIESLADSNVALNNLVDLHAQSFREAKIERLKAEIDFEEEESTLVARLTASRDSLQKQFLGNEDKILASFRLYLESIERDAPTIAWREYDGGIAGCMYEDGVIQRVEDVLSVRLEDLSFNAQQHLVRYMLTEDSTIFNRLKSVLGNQSKDNRPQVAEAFLATEFGDELGDAILDLAEADAAGEALHETLGSIQGIRASIAKIADSQSHLLSERPEFEQITNGMKRAVEQRVSEILSPLADLINGEAQVAVFTHNGEVHEATGKVETAEDILQGLRVLDAALEKIADSETASSWGDNTLHDQPANRHESQKSQVAVTMRSRQSQTGEARIAWTVQFAPEEQTRLLGEIVAFNAKGAPKSTPLTIRLDLEELSRALSLDIGGVSLVGRPLDQRVATAVSLGSQHLARRKGEISSDADYHVRDTFAGIQNSVDLFADFVDAKRHDIEIMRNKRVGKNALKITPGE